MIDYLTHPAFVGYNEDLPPSSQMPGVNAGGVLEALSTQYRQVQVIGTGTQLSNHVVLVDPLLFSLRPLEEAQREIELLKTHMVVFCTWRVPASFI